MQAITKGYYTRHAVQRCFERGIEPWAVDTVLARGVLVHDAPAGVQVFGLRRLRVVFDPATETVITVYRVPKAAYPASAQGRAPAAADEQIFISVLGGRDAWNVLERR